MKMIVIADDFTGANDTGVQLAKKGARTDVLFDIASTHLRTDVLVINTESRALNAVQAKERVTQALKSYCTNENSPLVYKKIDSTLRGNVGAEVEAAMLACGAKIAIVAAAIPTAGRITLNGQCLVHNVPLVETEFASDPKTPIISSHIKTLLASQTAIAIHELGLTDVRNSDLSAKIANLIKSVPSIVVMDAENESDLTTIAHAIVPFGTKVLLVGAAGLANALPTDCYLDAHQRLPVMVVAGSMSETTRKQITFSSTEKSLTIIDINVEELFLAKSREVMAAIEQQAIDVLRKNNHCILRTCKDEQERYRIDALCEKYQLSRQEFGEQISQCLGEITSHVISHAKIGGLFLTGGDIAIAVARALGAEGYRITHEVAPCVPCGTFINSDIDDLPVITKAGGFGSDSIIRDALYFIEEMYNGK